MDFGADFRLLEAEVPARLCLRAVAEIQERAAAGDFDNVDNRARHRLYPELAEADVVYLRAPVLQGQPGVRGDILDCENTPAVAKFPWCWVALRTALPDAVFGRVMVSRVDGPGRVATHVDAGAMAVQHRRHHVCLTVEDAEFTVGTTTVRMEPGSVWEINNRRPHSVTNHKGLRLHLIADVVPR